MNSDFVGHCCVTIFNWKYETSILQEKIEGKLILVTEHNNKEDHWFSELQLEHGYVGCDVILRSEILES